MTFRSARSLAILLLAFLSVSMLGTQCPLGLKLSAFLDLHQSGVDRYIGKFEPATSEPAGDWTKYTYDTEGGDGPICIDGSPFTVFTRERDPHKVVIFLNGGGACWQNFYFCSFQASGSPPPDVGMFASSFDDNGNVIQNPLADYSMVFVSYCDGSVFGGDNTVTDPSFTAGGGVRHHRGVRNVTAAIDLAHHEFPFASKVVLSGSSAGGFGTAGVSPFIVRFDYGNLVKFYVLNDSGPAITNLAQTSTIQTRVNDWAYTQFTPSSCTDCTTDKQPVELVEWMLQNDASVRLSLYSTDADQTIRFFLSVPTQAAYRSLLLNTWDPINAEFPTRMKRYIRSGSGAHTMLGDARYYTTVVNGTRLSDWVGGFVNQQSTWKDIVQDLIPSP